MARFYACGRHNSIGVEARGRGVFGPFSQTEREELRFAEQNGADPYPLIPFPIRWGKGNIFLGRFTQGRLAGRRSEPTLGFVAQSRWDRVGGGGERESGNWNRPKTLNLELRTLNFEMRKRGKS